MMESTQTPLTPMNFLKIFFRRKDLFLVPLYAGLILGVCMGIILPKKYLSSTILLIEEGKSDNPLFDKLAVSSTIMQRMAGIRESMLGWNSLVTLVRRLNMDQDIKTPQELEAAILGIRKDIIIKLKGQNIIELSYIGDTPEKTQAVVRNVAEIFIERNVDVQNKETSDAITFIEEQLKLYQGKIKSAEIAKLQDALDALLVDSTDEHPRVKQLREQIAAKKEELKKENLEYTKSSHLATQSTNRIIDEIKTALDKIEGGGSVKASQTKAEGTEKDLYKVMLIDRLDGVMARDVDVNTQIYNTLLQRLETAKITQRLQSSKEGTRYTVLDPPRIPLSPIKPNKILVALMGLFAGGLIGFGLVVAAEFLDKSFIDVEEAKNFLGMPLLGAISKINTQHSIQMERERLGWFYSLVVIAGGITVILTTAIMNFIR